MNQIQNLPNTYSAGLSFNYSVWSPGTVLTLCNVPWQSDYKDIVDFKSKAALDFYLSTQRGPSITFAASTYARSGMPVRIPLPFNDAYKYNYLRVTNPSQPSNPSESGSRSFYYFIRDIRHVAPNTTELELQLDVWQSFNRDIEFGSCFVERGHVGIADSNSFMDNGREILAQPEGFDVGSEYRIEKVYRKSYGSGRTGSYGIIVISTTALHTPPGTINDPRLIAAEGSMYENLPNGANSYYWDSIVNFQNFMDELKNYPWVAQGIIGIIAVPTGIVDIATETVDVTFTLGAGTYTVHKMGSKTANSEGPKPERTANVNLSDNFREDIASTKLVGRYRNLKKFLVYPYTVVELTTYNGAPLILKPECLTQNLNFIQFNHLAQPGPRVTFAPLGYNAGGGAIDGADDGAEFLDLQTGFFNFPQFSVVNNTYMNFMASNTHRIAFDFSQADWSQQRALRGNEVNLQQAKWSQDLLTNVTQLGADNAMINASIGGIAQGINANRTTKNLVPGTPESIQAADNLANMGTSLAASMGQTAITNAFNIAKTREVNKNIGRTADLNKEYGDWSARGDYANEIAGINARVQDARLFQPSVVGQMGGEAFNLAVHKWVLAAKVKMVTGAAFNAIGDYWLRYGYAINRFITTLTPSVMSNFTYWKVKELYIISGTCPEMFKMTIRAIFEKGVTVWNDPHDIGRIALDDNEPIVGSYINV